MKWVLCGIALGALAAGGFMVGASADGLYPWRPNTAATAPAGEFVGGATVIVPELFAEPVASRPVASADPAPPPAAKTAAPARPAARPAARVAPPPLPVARPVAAPPEAVAESHRPPPAVRKSRSLADWFSDAAKELEIEYRYPGDPENASDAGRAAAPRRPPSEEV